MSPVSGNYERFFELREGDLTAIDPNYERRKRKQKEKEDPFSVKPKKDGFDSMEESSEFSEEDDDYEDPKNYLDIIRKGLIDTRRILETLDEDGNVYNQLWEVFKIFSGNVKQDLNESYRSSEESVESLNQTATAKDNKDNTKKTMHVLTLP